MVDEWKDFASSLDESAVVLQLHFLEASVLAGDQEMAEVLARQLAWLAPYPWAQYGHTCYARHLGAAAALMGQQDQAKTFYHQALEVCAKIRFRPEIALTYLQLAALLLEHYPEERAEAVQHLDFSISEFQEMKMQPSLERALRHRGMLKA